MRYFFTSLWIQLVFICFWAPPCSIQFCILLFADEVKCHLKSQLKSLLVCNKQEISNHFSSRWYWRPDGICSSHGTFDSFSFFAQHLCVLLFVCFCLLNNFKFHTDCYQNYHGKDHFIYCCCGKMWNEKKAFPKKILLWYSISSV